MKWEAPGPAFLFCPADRPERFEKAARIADVVLIDLEDGVAPERREVAREAIRSADFNPDTTIIRVNPAGTDDHQRNVETVAGTGVRKVMLAKTGSADEVNSLAPFEVIALCESPAGVSAAAEIAACANTIALMWGSEDLVASLGGSSSRNADGNLSDLSRFARAKVLVDAGAVDVGALDTVFLDFGDLEGLRLEASAAAAMGFMATPCVHPSQVEVVREAYRPSNRQIVFAQEVLAAAQDRGGVFRLGDVMVDEPVLLQARLVLRRAGLLGRDDSVGGQHGQVRS